MAGLGMEPVHIRSAHQTRTYAAPRKFGRCDSAGRKAGGWEGFDGNFIDSKAHRRRACSAAPRHSIAGTARCPEWFSLHKENRDEDAWNECRGYRDAGADGRFGIGLP